MSGFPAVRERAPLASEVFKLKIDEQQAIVDAAEREGRSTLTPSEGRRFDILSEILDNLATGLQTEGIRPEPGGPDAFRGRSDPISEVRTLGKGESFADYVRAEGIGDPNQDQLSLGKYIKGIVTGSWNGAPNELKAMNEGTGSAGGFTVPAPLSAILIDKARNKARIFQAGARTVPMDSATLKMARVSGDPTATWKTESASITPDDMVFELVTFTARTLVAMTKLSGELLEDSLNVEAALTNAFGEALGCELDRAALRGTGTPPEPRGILNQSGITSTELNPGASPSREDLVDYGIGPIQDANHEATGIIWAPRTARVFDKRTTADGVPAPLTPLVASLPQYMTNQVPINLTVGADADCSEIYTGDFSQLLVGIRHQVTLQILKERYAESYDVGFLVHLRADIQVEHPEAFSVITGVRA